MTARVRDGFGDHELPFGVFSAPGRIDRARVGVAVGGDILDLAPCLEDDVFAHASLNAFLASGRRSWATTRARIRDVLDAGAQRWLVPADRAVLHLPFEVADFVDFNSSLQHTANVGQILRPGSDPVRPNWRRMPIGYHGRAGTVVVSGTPVVRPHGQLPDNRVAGATRLAPTTQLDAEAELGFVVGVPSRGATPVATGEFAEHVFGVVLLLDWSARDIQGYEYVPLGPFLGKSFATTISPWVVPLDVLDAARVAPPVQDPPPLDYLRVDEPWALDVRLELAINGEVVSRPGFSSMYWTPPQQLAHLTVNGAHIRTGDLFGSGTVSDDTQVGSLLELTHGGERAITLADGSVRGYLQDGDEVRLRATAPGPAGTVVSLGEAAGEIRPAAALRRQAGAR